MLYGRSFADSHNRLFVQVECFGSFTTRLYLPTSDIDMVVSNVADAPKRALNAIAEVLRSRALVSSIEVIGHARVCSVVCFELLDDCFL